MRWLLLLALVLCACGGSESGGENGACAEPPTIFRERYKYVANAGDAPPAGQIGRLVRPGCNDSNGPHEDDRRVAVKAIRGVDPRSAIIVEGAVYANARSFSVTRHGKECVVDGTPSLVPGRRCPRR